MKLLLDANISWRIIKIIEDSFPNCFHAKDIEVPQPAKDSEIWEFAKKNNFTILTHDEDFEKLLNEVILPDDTKIDENPHIAASSLYDEHKMIHGFLESSKKYVTNPRTD